MKDLSFVDLPCIIQDLNQIMTEVKSSYQLAIAYANLETSETLQDTFHALEHLNSIFTEVIDKIGTRVKEERHRIENIKKRTAICQDKVQQLRGSNQAVTVFSTAKYPAPKSLPPTYTLFGQITEVRTPKLFHCRLITKTPFPV